MATLTRRWADALDGTPARVREIISRALDAGWQVLHLAGAKQEVARHFDAEKWAQMFADAVMIPEMTPDGGGFRVNTRLARLKLAYTTVMTVMDNLHSKGFVAREKQGKAYLYTPTTSREEHTAELIDGVLDRSDDPDESIRRLIDFAVAGLSAPKTSAA